MSKLMSEQHKTKLEKMRKNHRIAVGHLVAKKNLIGEIIKHSDYEECSNWITEKIHTKHTIYTVTADERTYSATHRELDFYEFVK